LNFTKKSSELFCTPNIYIIYIYIYIYYTLIKKFPEFIQKIQNTSFIHQKWYYPLQSTPHRLQRTYASALDPALETFLELYCRYSHQSRLRFYLLSAVKTRLVFWPVMVFWLDRTEKNRRESYQVNSMAVGWFVSFLIKNSRIMMARCGIMVQNPRVIKNRKYVQR